MNIVFDIETLALPFESLSHSQQEYIQRYANKIEDENERLKKMEENIKYLPLYPFTAKIIAVGMYEIKSKKGIVLYESSLENELWKSVDETFKFQPADEKYMIDYFWSKIVKAKQIISFNGKNFDIPFLKIRSAINQIKVPKMNNILHTDLLDELTFYGKIRKFNLDFYCHAFGIETPKTDFANGLEVSNLYQAQRYKEIAEYCSRDLIATAKLFEIFQNYL
jgi:hypothetical protein